MTERKIIRIFADSTIAYRFFDDGSQDMATPHNQNFKRPTCAMSTEDFTENGGIDEIVEVPLDAADNDDFESIAAAASAINAAKKS